MAGEKRDIRDFSRLNIRDGVIHYVIHGQDGTRVPMTAPDRLDNRLFVSWVQIHDSYVRPPHAPSPAGA